jgi:hypothetical protein
MRFFPKQKSQKTKAPKPDNHLWFAWYPVFVWSSTKTLLDDDRVLGVAWLERVRIKTYPHTGKKYYEVQN